MSHPDQTPRLPDFLVREQSAAEFLDVSVRTLQAWRQNGDGPPFHKVGARAVRYRFSELEDWVTSQTHDFGTTL